MVFIYRLGYYASLRVRSVSFRLFCNVELKSHFGNTRKMKFLQILENYIENHCQSITVLEHRS